MTVRRLPQDCVLVAYRPNGDTVLIALRDAMAVDRGDLQSGVPVALRRGAHKDSREFVGQDGEVTVDSDLLTLRVHDGKTKGGEVLCRLSDISTKQGVNLVTAHEQRIAVLENTANWLVKRATRSHMRRIRLSFNGDTTLWDAMSSSTFNLNGRAVEISADLPLESEEELHNVGFGAFINGGDADIQMEVWRTDLSTQFSQVVKTDAVRVSFGPKDKFNTRAVVFKFKNPLAAAPNSAYQLVLKVKKDSKGTVFKISDPWIQKAT